MRWTQVVEFVSGSMATVFNLILISIILVRSSTRIGKYKYFLLAYTLNACYFTIAQIIIIPVCLYPPFYPSQTWFIPTNGYFFLSTLNYLPRWTQQIGVMSFVATYTINAIVLTWSFVYRLAVIESPHPWIVQFPYFPICLLSSLLLAVWMVGSCQPIMPTLETDEIFHEEILNKTGVNLSEIGYIGGEITINGQINVGMAVCLGSFIAFVCACCLVFLVCWFKIGRTLQAIRTMGTHTNYNFHYRLFILLTLQTCMPIVFNIFPAASCFILSLAKVQSGNFPYICAMIVTFAQVCDPIFTIFFIAEYKSLFLNCLAKTFGKVRHSSSHINTGTLPQPTAPDTTHHSCRCIAPVV